MIRWYHLDQIAAELRAEWNKDSPTRFVVIEGMMEEGVCQQLADFSAISDMLRQPLQKSHKHVRGKVGVSDRMRMSDIQRTFFEAINSRRFLSFLESITGIVPIYADESLNGGGLHEIRTGGYLNVHVDFNFDPISKRNRRLNLLLYLNDDWRNEWNGDIELWDRMLDRPFFSACPSSNRVLIFETSETSYHGHPAPLASPPSITRKSMAVYYYSDWQEGTNYRKHTNYQLTRSQWAQLISRIAKLMSQRHMTEEEIVSELQLDYMTGDIQLAYTALMNLHSAPVCREEYWEDIDGTYSLTKPYR